MHQLPILLRREFWEHKGIFLYFPLTISAVVIALILLTTFVVKVTVGERQQETSTWRDRQNSNFEWRIEESDGRPLQDIYMAKLQELSRQDARHKEVAVGDMLRDVGAPIRVTLWFVIFFYLLGSLYEERKDRSVLFWKSMPVSDAMTVLSKLLAAAIVAPALAFVCILTTQFAVLVVASVVSISADVAVWSTVWAPAQLYSYWPLLLTALTLQVFWSLPIYGFVLLVSCFARSVPLVWVLAVPAGIALVESMLSRQNWFSNFFVNHMAPLSIGADADELRDWSELLDKIFSFDMGIGLLVGAVLLFATIRLRGRSDEI